jgi:hypothetical protein
LADLADGCQPFCLVLTDAAGRQLGQRGLGAELRLQQFELALVLLDRALPGLGGEVALGGLGEANAGGLRRRRLDLQQLLRQFGLGFVLRPLGLVAANLLAVDLRREPPSLALGALAGDLPESFA